MRAHRIVAASAMLGLSCLNNHALAGCNLNTMVALPVTMNGNEPLVAAKINGADATFLLDSGGIWNMISPATAAEFKLSPRPFKDLQLVGMGGTFDVSAVNVKNFTLAGVPFTDVKFLVGGSEIDRGAHGLLGQNLLRIWDVDYDFANGMVKLVKPVDCGDKPLVYWTQTQPYSVLKLKGTSDRFPHTASTLYINGAEIKVVFDTGAPFSLMALHTAARAGINPKSPGVTEAGVVGGLGTGGLKSWIATFASFKIGDEEIRNARLRFGDFREGDFDMLLGADFFLSHHVLVATSQGKMYFTYNGGPVFNLKSQPAAAASANADPATATSSSGPVIATAAPSSAPLANLSEGSQTSDAADFARRGSAFAARHDFLHAIAELSRACELKPDEPQFFYERGMAHADNGEAVLARADFDQTLKLKPNDVSALIARAGNYVDAHESSKAIADLDAADRAAAKELNERLHMATLYESANNFASAISQYDSWIASHSVDARLDYAFGKRCRARAVLGRDLDKALDDCNIALSDYPHEGTFLESRALTHLRRGDLSSSIWDYNAAIKADPRSYWALYGRGLAKLRKGKTAEGQADIKAAEAMHPGISEEAGRHGLSP